MSGEITLVARLRKLNAYDCCIKGADEIERLQNELLRARKDRRLAITPVNDTRDLERNASHYAALLIQCQARGFTDPMQLIEEYDALVGPPA